MTRSLSMREKWLALGVAAVGFLLITVFLCERFLQNGTQFRSEIAARRKQLHFMRNLMEDFPVSEQREAWVQASQPKLINPDTAGVQLLNEVKEVARRHGVLLENPAIRAPERHPEYVSIAIEVESKSPWKPLIAFQYDLQNPAQFIALESANLKIDGADPTRMHGRFKISRWFAPQ